METPGYQLHIICFIERFGMILWQSETTDLGYFEINHIALKNYISSTCDFPAFSGKVKKEGNLQA